MEFLEQDQSSRLSKLLRSVDIFPLQLGFTHQRYRTYRTPSSGCFSILTLLVIFSYFLYLGKDIWNFKVQIKNSLKKRDVTFDQTPFNMTDYDFDFALKLQYLGTNETRRNNIHQFVSINVQAVSTEWVTIGNETRLKLNLTQLGVEKCTDSAFNNDTRYLEKLKIVGNYFCPKSKDFQLVGGQQNDLTSLLSINVRECNQDQLDIFQPGEVCADLSEQQEVASQLLANFIFTNQYFSGENKEEPIQYDYKIMTLGVPFGQAFYTLAKLSINNAILEDSWFFDSYQARNVSYSSIRIDSQYSRAQIPYSPNTPFLSVAVFLDENVDVNERTAFNLVMALQQIGGFASVVMVISRIIFTYVQRFNYFQEMVSKLYSTDTLSLQNIEPEKELSISQNNNSSGDLKQRSHRFSLAQHKQLVLDPERSSSKVQQLRTVLYEKVYNQLPVKSNIWTYSISFCKKTSHKTKHFNEGYKILQQELTLEYFIRYTRMIQLYLDINLTSVQKTLLRGMSQRRLLSQPEKDQNEVPVNSRSKSFNGTDLLSYRDSVDAFVDSVSSGSATQFDRKLIKYLGFDFAGGTHSRDRKEKIRKKSPRNIDGREHIPVKNRLFSSRRKQKAKEGQYSIFERIQDQEEEKEENYSSLMSKIGNDKS